MEKYQPIRSPFLIYWLILLQHQWFKQLLWIWPVHKFKMNSILNVHRPIFAVTLAKNKYIIPHKISFASILYKSLLDKRRIPSSNLAISSQYTFRMPANSVSNDQRCGILSGATSEGRGDKDCSLLLEKTFPISCVERSCSSVVPLRGGLS